MLKKRKKSVFARFCVSTAGCGEIGSFSVFFGGENFFNTVFFFFRYELWKKKDQCRELILVFSSFTTSAKAESFFIFFSTWVREYATVAWSRLSK